MDADHLMQVVKAKDGNGDIVRQYMLTSGTASSVLEHRLPEQQYSTPDNPVQGISTIKALKIANDQGVPIYTIDQENLTIILPQLQIGQQVKDDIQNAVNSGKVVTVSKTNISLNGWSGCGYIISDPDTGAGAYMISGGSNGAALIAAYIGIFALQLVLALTFTGWLAVFIIPIVIALIQVAMTMYIKWMYDMDYRMSDKQIKAVIFDIALQMVLGPALKVTGEAVKSTMRSLMYGILTLMGMVPDEYIFFYVKFNNFKSYSLRLVEKEPIS